MLPRMSGVWRVGESQVTQSGQRGQATHRAGSQLTNGKGQASKQHGSSTPLIPHNLATQEMNGGAAASATSSPRSTVPTKGTAVRAFALVPTRVQATPTTSPTSASKPANTVTATPTNTPVLTATPISRPTLRSGIGLAWLDWERRHGPAEQNIGGLVTYEHGRYVVAFLHGKVRHVEYTWGGKGVPMSVARSESKTLLPADAVMVRRFSPNANYVTEVYMSAYIRKRFRAEQADLWFDSKPGSLHVLYRISNGRVISIIVDAGTMS